MRQTDKILKELPCVIGRAVVKAMVASEAMPPTPREIKRKKYGNPLWLILAVWVGYPLFVAIIMGLLIWFTR